MDSLLGQIDTLVKDDDSDRLKPTAYAYAGALAILGDLDDIPQATITTDASGALYIAWRNRTKHLQLTSPANEKVKPYIYWRDGEDSDLLTNADAPRLAEWLTWLAR